MAGLGASSPPLGPARLYGYERSGLRVRVSVRVIRRRSVRVRVRGRGTVGSALDDIGTGLAQRLGAEGY